jgi:predicted 3-demethylubiquinone-9 3-methyltransferase (glyoxalase superfamily)
MQPITPCLWFDHQAEEAAEFYTSIFRNANIGRRLGYLLNAGQLSVGLVR